LWLHKQYFSSVNIAAPLFFLQSYSNK
jgi:hypothetical protein